MSELVACYNKTLEDIVLLEHQNYIDFDGLPSFTFNEFEKKRKGTGTAIKKQCSDTRYTRNGLISRIDEGFFHIVEYNACGIIS